VIDVPAESAVRLLARHATFRREAPSTGLVFSREGDTLVFAARTIERVRIEASLAAIRGQAVTYSVRPVKLTVSSLEMDSAHDFRLRIRAEWPGSISLDEPFQPSLRPVLRLRSGKVVPCIGTFHVW